jgi:two-component system, OmpR family, sensor histidine kinase QseC
MKALLRPSIARRLFWALLLACALVWSGIYALGSHQVRQANTGSFDSDMQELALSIVSVATTVRSAPELNLALLGIDSSLDANQEVNKTPSEFQVYYVWDQDGGLVRRSRHSVAAYRSVMGASGFSDVSIGGRRYRMLSTSASSYRVEVTQSVQSRKEEFDRVMLSRDGLLSPLLVGFPLLLIPILLAIRSGLKPLQVLASELAARSPDDLRPIDAPHVYSELAPIARELNSTLFRLRALLQRERDFVADAAHEIRTPLALITAQADTLIYETEPEARAAAGHRMRQGLARSSRLVNQLLALARLEADAEVDQRRIDVADLCRDVLAASAREAEHRSIELSYCGPDRLEASVPGDAVESLVANLVSNGVRHGRENGRVQVDLVAEPTGHLVLHVRDDGTGLATAERDRVFGRFQRGRHATAVGSGLGLAIVRSSARQLGAEVELTPGLDERGLGVRVRWHPATALGRPAP